MSDPSSHLSKLDLSKFLPLPEIVSLIGLNRVVGGGESCGLTLHLRPCNVIQFWKGGAK